MVLTATLQTPYGAYLRLPCGALVNGQYHVEVAAPLAQTNHRGTVHGGFIQLILDEFAAQFVMLTFAAGQAVTSMAVVNFIATARPTLPLHVQLTLARRGEHELTIEGPVTQGKRIVAMYVSTWLLHR